MTPIGTTLALFSELEENEEWRIIDNFPDYAVSNIGRVKRLTNRTSGKAGRLVKSYSFVGYPSVVLCGRRLLIHRLVAGAFLPKIEGKNEVNHLNGDKGDPCLSNLEYVSRSENQLHAYKIGLQKAASENAPNVKLDREKVAEIRRLANTLTYFEIAPLFGITYSNVGRIVRMETWVDADCPTKMVVVRKKTPKKKPRFAIHIRRAKKRGSEVHSSHVLLEQKLEYYGNRCRYCHCLLDDSNVSFDHAIPLSRGGTSWTANYMPCCRTCNNRKRNKTFREFLNHLKEKRKAPLFGVQSAQPDNNLVQ